MRLWDTATGKQINPLAGHTGEVNVVHFSANAKSLWSVGQEGKVLEWERATSKERRVLFDALAAPPKASNWKPLDLTWSVAEFAQESVALTPARPQSS